MIYLTVPFCNYLLLILLSIKFGYSPKLMMKAMTVSKFGSPDVLQMTEIIIPKIRFKEVLVKVKAVGINPMDAYMRSGSYPVKPQLPAILGREISGIVEDCNDYVTTLRVGDRVFCGIFNGGYAQFVVTDENDCYPLHERLTFEQGAALFVPYLTAHRALLLSANVTKNDAILIHGAYIGIGTAAVQIAKHAGSRVVATVQSTADGDTMKANGADYVVFHNEQNYIEEALLKLNKSNFDVIVEYLPSADEDEDKKYLSEGGRMAGIGYHGYKRSLWPSVVSTEGAIYGVTFLDDAASDKEKAVQYVLDGVKDGWLTPVVGRVYKLEEASEAHRSIVNVTDEFAGKSIFVL